MTPAATSLLLWLAVATQPAAGCSDDTRLISQVTGWQVRWTQAFATLAAQPADARSEAIAAWGDTAAEPRADIATLRAGLRATAPRPVVDRVRAQIRGLQAQLAAMSLASDPAWRRLLDDELRPAVAAYAAFLDHEYRPRATREAGLAGIPGGPECFVDAVENWTTLRLSPDEMEAIGRRLLTETRSQMARTAGVPPSRVLEVIADLREVPRSGTADELLAVSRAAVARATAAAPRSFSVGALPPVAVEALPAALQPSYPSGFYRAATQAAAAAFVVNPSRPAERKLMAEAIAFHETLPGHHLAATLSGSTGGFNAGFAEGWAIYAEGLADEMGLYSTRRDRLGMRAKHLWAASRLIVEPGLHVRGWSRDEAIDFMRANTALSDVEIAVEIDRYLAMPGQSLAYMLGADRLRRARVRAQQALGRRFDLRAFHDVVLRAGVRSLAVVDHDVDRWIDSARRPPTR